MSASDMLHKLLSSDQNSSKILKTSEIQSFTGLSVDISYTFFLSDP